MLEYPEVQRRAFLLDLSRALQKVGSAPGAVGLVVVDVTNLSRINRLYGHPGGDRVLATVLARLDSASGEGNRGYRIASHHFAIILPKLRSRSLIALAANRLRAALVEPVDTGQEQVALDICVGLATSTRRDAEADELLAAAENSLRNNRDNPGYDLLETEEDSVQLAKERNLLEQEFTETLRANAFELFYQPKVNLRTGDVTSCEALLRWPRPDGGYLSPGIAIEIAESLDLGYGLSKWILGEAIRQAKTWRERFDLKVAVNIEANLIESPDLYNLVADTLSIWGTAKDLVNLEITESAVLGDHESSFDNLRKLKEFGIGLSIDDFGTGYSSLAYFRDIPAQELKIDQSFVSDMDSDGLNRALVNISVQIAHLFGMTAVGEGVESEATLDALLASGCDHAQGFYFSRALPVPEFETWLEAWPGLEIYRQSTRGRDA